MTKRPRQPKQEEAEKRILNYLINEPQGLKEITEEDFASQNNKELYLQLRKIKSKPSYEELFSMCKIECKDIYNMECSANPQYWSELLRKYTLFFKAKTERTDIFENISSLVKNEETGEEHYCMSTNFLETPLKDLQKEFKKLNSLRERKDRYYTYKCTVFHQGFDFPDEIPGADKELGWLVEDILAQDDFHEIVGPQKTAKTQLAFQLAYCVQNGIDFLGHHTKQVDVGYVDYELEPSDLKDRYYRVNEFYRKHYNFQNGKPFKIMSMCHDTDNDIDDVLKIIQEEKTFNSNLGLIILDNFFSLLSNGSRFQ